MTAWFSLIKKSIDCVSNYFSGSGCPDFEASADMQPLTLELTLSLREWKAIATSSRHSLLANKFIDQVRAATNLRPTNDNDGIPF